MYILKEIALRGKNLSHDRLRMLYASSAERFISLYHDFQDLHQRGNEHVIKEGLAMAWRSLGEKDVALSNIDQIYQDVLNVAPTAENDSTIAFFAELSSNGLPYEITCSSPPYLFKAPLSRLRSLFKEFA
jgi:hypothetical protein